MNENSWECSEVSIYVQAAYINLLASVLGLSVNPGCDPVILATHALDFAVDRKGVEVLLKWRGNQDVVRYRVQMSNDGSLLIQYLVQKGVKVHFNGLTDR